MEKVTKCHKIYLIECIKNKLRNSQVDFNIFKDYLWTWGGGVKNNKIKYKDLVA